MSRMSRRVSTGLAAALVGAALVAPAITSTAQAAPGPQAFSSAKWLEDQLTDGLVYNEQFMFNDFGLSLDVFFALEALDTRPNTRASILDAFDTQGADYVAGFGGQYAGSYGKLATAYQLAGRPTGNVDGLDLIANLEGLVVTADTAEQGRGKDTPTDFSNAIGQSFVVRALDGAGSDLADEATAFLLKQQCADGFFRVPLSEGDGTFSCDGAENPTPSVDATAFAVTALSQVGGQDAAVADALDWLEANQNEDGSFGDAGVANSNSSGLAAGVLAATGRADAADSGAAFVSTLLATSVSAGGSALADEVGAIAFNAAAFEAGKAEGITVETRDQWIRATTQAAIGLDALRGLTVVVPDGYVGAGTEAKVKVTGLEAGEQFTVLVGGGSSVTGVMPATGAGKVTVDVPGGTKQRPVTVIGNRIARQGDGTLDVLGKADLQVKLAKERVAKRATQDVTVRDLAPGEKVVVRYAGDRVDKGKANDNGVFRTSFKVGAKSGQKKVVAVGEFDNRTGSKVFRVR